MKVLIPNTIELPLTADVDAVVYDTSADIPDEHRDAEMLVVWGNSASWLQNAAGSLPRLRLVQALASGADAVLNAGFGSEVRICSGRSLHDGPVAEHALALILSAVRRIDRLRDAQREHRWDDAFNQEQAASATRAHHTLDGAHVTIWGFGSIASTLAPLLAALGAQVEGIARTAGHRAGFEVHADADAPALLAQTDVLVSILPATDATADLFDAEVFGALKRGAVFVNVGRGATVDETALIDALESGQLRAAAIDVAKAEPLPASDPLWDTPNLLLTPHVAGNRPVGAADLVDENIARLRAGDELVNQVHP
ncbi:phosphoglycerate dehydrogenase [Microbacterium foliorum]|uniref:Glyoxylate/hydroxypyruvate reductase A n=1 Tax=Microbacterium foliorum TaxID=104336 RepID=A0A0F0KEC4_9MICO|nr:NAD(P)-dependent oxidoreductase [Microbacterium foliorum]AXL11253.1 phosphoglycerate dehydrogenase [Microbacterium foliorum]KJL19198.1 Glyoxylate/hydroxypyruvate reductase A [Microbacterium foliorum]